MQTRDEVEGLHNCREFSQPFVLKELLKDKGIAFSSNAKKSELVKVLMPFTIPLVDLAA